MLSGKIAVVTGGSRGIGRAISIALAQAGAEVTVTYEKQAGKAQEVIKEIRSFGGVARDIQMDVRSRESVHRTFSDIKAVHNRLDILVNNAGINKPADFDQVEDADWDEVLAVNLRGPFICAQEALPLLRLSGGGSIINIGSVSGQYGGPRTAHYAASKAGLISLGQVIARFGAKDNIRCNTIAAGLIASEMASASLLSPTVTKAAESILLKRFGTPNEVADAVVFLASDKSRYITAQTINVNGGLYF
jgi:3-oxoacyl-[acyl-carrier protein] reductase